MKNKNEIIMDIALITMCDNSLEKNNKKLLLILIIQIKMLDFNFVMQ